MANEPTIAEMNITIAYFMGYHYMASKFYSKERGTKPNYFKEAKYHTSWDWLMPVVEKIEGLEWCVRVENWPKKFKPPYKEHYSVWMWLNPEDCPEIQTYSDSKIDAVYNAVYQFITWYNQQKQKYGQ